MIIGCGATELRFQRMYALYKFSVIIKLLFLHVILLFELLMTLSADVRVSCLYHYSSRGRKTHESEGVFSAKKCIAWFHEYTGMSNAVFLTQFVM